MSNGVQSGLWRDLGAVDHVAPGERSPEDTIDRRAGSLLGLPRVSAGPWPTGPPEAWADLFVNHMDAQLLPIFPRPIAKPDQVINRALETAARLNLVI